jgi:hypothetical protein
MIHVPEQFRVSSPSSLSPRSLMAATETTPRWFALPDPPPPPPEDEAKPPQQELDKIKTPPPGDGDNAKPPQQELAGA